jgi:hypothetical protein
MLRKAEYFAGTIIYAVRRGLGKKIDGKSLAFKPLSYLFLSLEDRRAAFAPVDWLTFLLKEIYGSTAFSALNLSRLSHFRRRLHYLIFFG